MAGPSVAGGVCVWQSACVVGGMHARGVCVPGGTCMAGEMATAAGGTHATGMHFCSTNLAPVYNMIPGMKYTNRRIQHQNKIRQSVRKSAITPTTTPTIIHLSETHKYMIIAFW